jgi:hypothetical protein
MAKAKDIAALAGLAGLAYANRDKLFGGSSKGPSATAAEEEASKVRMDAQKNAVSGNRVTDTGDETNRLLARSPAPDYSNEGRNKPPTVSDSVTRSAPKVASAKPAVAADEPAGLTTPVSSANRTDQLANLSRAVKREEKTKKAAQGDFSGITRTYTKRDGTPAVKAQETYDTLNKKSGANNSSAMKTDALAVASRAARVADAKRRAAKQSSYKSGGMTSSASSRADGIATKGKTRGKIC